jgi:hypothetical protein
MSESIPFLPQTIEPDEQQLPVPSGRISATSPIGRPRDPVVLTPTNTDSATGRLNTIATPSDQEAGTRPGDVLVYAQAYTAPQGLRVYCDNHHILSF